MRVVGAAHDLPCVAVIVDVAAPAERLVPHAHAVLRGQIAQLAKILRHAVDAAERGGMHGRADQHQVGAQLVHQLELALGPGEGAGALRLGQRLEVAERLEQRDLQPVVAHHPPDLGRGEVRGEEILLEDLDPVEARARRWRPASVGRLPETETVAIEVFMRPAPRPDRRAAAPRPAAIR